MPAHLRLVIVILTVALSACGRRAGLNFGCAWVPDPTYRVDFHDAAHVDHVLDDLRVADELAIRYGDRVAGWRLTETFGIASRHGGVKDRDLGRRSREQCLANLSVTIGSNHGVSLSDLDALRPRLRGRGFNLPVTIPLAVLFMWVVGHFTRSMRERLAADEWMGWLGGTVLGSLIIPPVVLAVGSAWAVAVEIVRLGNEHLGHRAGADVFAAPVLVLLGIGVASVWVSSAIAFIRSRAEVAQGPVRK
ncbi:MAG: hypothetical protein U0Q12_13865 [Vicinamibacterales bacterium]